VNLAIRIVSTPERAGLADALQHRIGGEIIVDPGCRGTFGNHKAALASVTDATHAVIVEDDAIPCPDFIEHVEHLIAERPTHLIGLYVGRSRPQRIQPILEPLVAQADWWLDDARVTDRLRWGVGYTMPAADIPAVLEHLNSGSQHAWIAADSRIGAWHADRGLLSYPIPSPLDHNDDVPSTTSRHGQGRRAWAHCSEVHA